ncbi:MAG: response regulator [Alphaproteobacteria bacterium]
MISWLRSTKRYFAALLISHSVEPRKESVGAALIPKTPPDDTVLIVEDFTANVMVATMMLEHMGYKTEVARCGAEAVAKVSARTIPYVAILMDVQMHDMDGFEATRQIRAVETEKNFRHFIIGVTAHAMLGDRDQCIRAGMNDYISKPLHPDILAKRLRATHHRQKGVDQSGN